MTTLSSIPWYCEYYKSNVNLQFVNWYYYRVCEDWVNIRGVILKNCQKFTFAISFGQKLKFPDGMKDLKIYCKPGISFDSFLSLDEWYPHALSF